MAKVMLVEDDNNLREIYVARLAAEGYETASAHDGEEALALAVKEKPDLIISDVMMPKISGFDMLDILRSTPETKNTKVIMMTALSQAEDRERADKLGADRYLVKSQVTLEDVIKVAHEVLEDDGAAPAAASTAPAAEPTTASSAPASEPKDEPADNKPVDEPAETPATTPDPTPAPSLDPTPVPAPDPVPDPKADPTPAPIVEPTPAEPPSTPAPEPDSKADEPIADVAAATAPAPTVIEPTSIPVSSDDDTKDDKTDDKEEAAGVKTEAEATNDVEKQIKDFVDNSPELNSPSTAKEAPQITTSPNSIPISTPDDNEPASKADEPAKDTAPASVAENNSVIGEPPSHKKLVLEPTGNATKPTVDLDALLAKEDAKEASSTPQTNDIIQPSAASSSDATPDSSDQPADKLSDISL